MRKTGISCYISVEVNQKSSFSKFEIGIFLQSYLQNYTNDIMHLSKFVSRFLQFYLDICQTQSITPDPISILGFRKWGTFWCVKIYDNLSQPISVVFYNKYFLWNHCQIRFIVRIIQFSISNILQLTLGEIVSCVHYIKHKT